MEKNKKFHVFLFLLAGMFLWNTMFFLQHSFSHAAEEQAIENTTENMEQNIVENIVENTTAKEEEKDVFVDEIQNAPLNFDEKIAKLISYYDKEIEEDEIASLTKNPYKTRRLIVRGEENANLDFSSCNADIVINGPEQIFVLQFSSEELTEQAEQVINEMDGVKYCEVDGYDYLEEPTVSGISNEKDADKDDGNKKDADSNNTDNNDTDKIAAGQNILSWGTKHIFADQYAKILEKNQTEILVGVVDTGINVTHPFLEGRITLENAYNYVVGNENVEDDNGHGTHVSGIIVDATPNLNIKILPVKCMNEKGNGSYLNIANAIKRAADAGVKVINYSAVGNHSQYKEEAVQYAIEKGVSVVVAAGNSGQSIDSKPVCPSHIEECIVAGSINQEDERAATSNYGEQLDLMAPGVDIRSAYLNGQYAYMTGTSMAAPYVTAAAAMLKLEYPSLTPSLIEEKLKQNARDLGEAGEDIYYGAGRLDLSKFHHNYGEVQITKATPKQNGEIRKKCMDCGIEESEIIYYPEQVNLSQTEYIYTGKPKKPTATVIDAAGEIVDTSNYTISYEKGRIEVGTYTITVKFKGDLYEGAVKREIHINKATQKFSGGGCTKRYGDAPFFLTSVKRTRGDGILTYVSSNPKVADISADGEVTVKTIGRTTITITAQENEHYKEAVKKVTVTVKPVTMNMTDLRSNVAGHFTAYWIKNETITAYQMQYATKSNFSDAITKTVKDVNKTSKTMIDLPSGQKYYVRLRTYKTVDNVKYYSLWSEGKTVTVK